MKKLFFPFLFILLLSTFPSKAQCHFIPATSSSTDTLSYTFIGGSFQSNGCSPIDPTYWMSNGGHSVNINFVTPQSYPSFRIWGMNLDDIVSVSINGASYLLNIATASYDEKVLCGISPGPDGVSFNGGRLFGVNTNQQGNFSYQNIQLNVTNIMNFGVHFQSGLGCGFAGVSVGCPLPSGLSSELSSDNQIEINPNPMVQTAVFQAPKPLRNARFSVYNTYGQLVYEEADVSRQLVNFYRETLPSGAYFLVIYDNDLPIARAKFLIAN